jgi:pyruvate dehydrogenase E2 component (dihydrolipoamide acetyltransferase)
VRRDVEARIEEGAPEEGAPARAPEREEEEAAPTPQPAVSEQPAYQLPSQVAPEGEEAPYRSEPITQMRKTIARRLAQSKYTAPHFYLTADLDVGKAVALRKELNELAEAQDRPRISFNDLITKACALALTQHPDVNASYLAEEGEIRHYNQVHVGIAVAIDEGLMTPVIRNADQKGLAQIATETKDLAEKARNRDLQPEDYEGATFTTSNLGMFGIEEFTAIINPPNGAILAIGEIREEPVVEDGEIVVGQRMKVTLSCDHRVVDGAVGARFLQTVRDYLEEPMNLMM